MKSWVRALALALVGPLVLAGCLFMPGKFDSTLTIHADRSFAFTYKGEVTAVDLDAMMSGFMKGFAAMAAAGAEGGEGADDATPPGDSAEDAAEAAEKAAEADAKYRELAGQLSKEAGYNKVEYRGNGTFYVDYAITGTLTHSFVYPYNQDAAMMIPWMGVELRGKDMVAMRAPAFAKQEDSLGGMGGDKPESKTEGTFTLITDAEVTSTSDGGTSTRSGGTSTITWKITPDSTEAPAAVLRVKPM